MPERLVFEIFCSWDTEEGRGRGSEGSLATLSLDEFRPTMEVGMSILWVIVIILLVLLLLGGLGLTAMKATTPRRLIWDFRFH